MTTLDMKRISDLFVAAIGSWNGGARYWCHEARLLRSDVKPTKHPWFADAAVFAKPFEAELVYDKTYEGMGDGRKVITNADCRHALEAMRKEKHSAYGGDADALMQVLVEGKVVFDDAPKPSPFAPAEQEKMERWIAEVVERARVLRGLR